MIFALGFLIAGLIALAIAPAFWHRALRLTTRRIEMQIPLSAREILADRDLIRAEFAVERRRLEQKAQSLNETHAKDLSEIGRRAAAIVAQQAEIAALGQRKSEQDAELAALRRTLAEASAERAATETALHGAHGLFERRDAQLIALWSEFRALQALADDRRTAMSALESDIADQQKKLVAETATVARLEQQIQSMRLEHDADLATLKATATKLADREQALKAAEHREMDLHWRRKQQIETTRAVERRLLEKVERLRVAEAAAHAALEASRANCDSLTRELAALRLGFSAPAASEREENAILRQNINEIGAAIIRMASGVAGPALEETPPPEDVLAETAGKPSSRILAKAGSGGSVQ
ncbi:hypothetical protein [Methylocapsa aurea]|uniref:hypothetical protein n=1 Tax=Methylocapsa aurea TaxID=663610 RepID=UPI0012EB8DAF|nr:hypothetical protein [Methylocapsa aurea]